MHAPRVSGQIPRPASKIGGAEPAYVTSSHSVRKAQVGLYMGIVFDCGLTSGAVCDTMLQRFERFDRPRTRDRKPVKKAPAELSLPGADTGGDVSRAREVYPEGCLRIHPSEDRRSPPRARRSAPALQRRQLGILPARGNGPARAVSAYRRADGRSSAAALVSQPEENTRASLTPDGASDRDRIAQAVEKEIERLRKLRPELDSRIDRAASILVMQLSSHPRFRPVRVRVQGVRVRFL